MTRQMVMVGFLQAQNCTNLPSSWRHPESRDDSMSSDYYQEIARVLEAGKFHMHGINADREQWHEIVSRVIRGDLAGDACSLGSDGDCGTGDN